MSYFKDHYQSFRYPLKDNNINGLRKAQLGAIHSIAGHFSNKKEPAIVTMPTGSGKTAVLNASAFLLQANRILIITPSRLVREQITDEISNLITLKETEALPQDLETPRVLSVRNRIVTIEEWESMREYDAVVATVQGISPEFEVIPEPPADLFDLVLVDEAHHSPARTWQSVLNHFNNAKQILFTATPFRQDQREIKGRFVFTYDLKDAFSDGIFGEINFLPVTPENNLSHDESIAIAIEQKFRDDTELGFNHKIMVRTDGISRAKELVVVYQRITNLRLEIVTGQTSLRKVKKIIENLTNGELDGIICVNMLGEGFNFPSLKIAAIHAPHKSLSVTLQFVGRFARTVGINLGPATFLAIPSDIQIEAERLYDTRAVWQDKIHNLSALRISQEIETREVLHTFTTINSVQDISDLSLYVLEPYYHVKIYQLESDIDINQEIEFPENLQIAYHGVSTEYNAAVYITREISLPKWTNDDRLSNIASDLFIFYYNQPTKLFFICASKKTAGLYDKIMDSFGEAEPRPLPLVRLNKALNDLTATEFFNVGMRNRVPSNTTESYKIIAGSNADKSVLRSDSRLYHRGHAFGRANENGNPVTIGLSSASKIWSNKSSRLPELILWCINLANKINSDRNPVTHSGLDFLDPGEELEKLPEDIIAVDWPKNVYQNPISTRFLNAQGVQVKAPLLDFNLKINQDESTEDYVVIELSYDTTIYKFTFSFGTNRFYEPATDNEQEIEIEHDRQYVPLIDFFNNFMLIFYTSDLSLIDGCNIFRVPQETLPPYSVEGIDVLDWNSENTNIQCEFGNAGVGKISVHTYIERYLLSLNPNVIYYDHGTGEIADFVSFTENSERLIISFYHCKKSPSSTPGHRLDSINDLTGQIVKSIPWTSKQRILNNIRRRFTNNVGSHTFIKGDLDELEELLSNITPASIDFEYIAVQPGLKKQEITSEILNMLASTNDYLIRGGFKALRVLSS